ncbi:MAG: hypothetical protein CM1200mP41_01630 [Gammaproteobacteria bacterium]|nr:MAG: hypothetical protein CM1200mP41_01630 [Gammaproteobacteria bacterium]
MVLFPVLCAGIGLSRINTEPEENMLVRANVGVIWFRLHVAAARSMFVKRLRAPTRSRRPFIFFKLSSNWKKSGIAEIKAIAILKHLIIQLISIWEKSKG